MKKLLYISLVLIIVLNYNSKSDFYSYRISESINTIGVQPQIILFDTLKNNLHVFCCGKDLNFNEKFDNGDIKPTWEVIDLDAKPHKSISKLEFPFRSIDITNFRPWANFAKREIYLPINDSIQVYDLDYFSIKEDITINSSHSAAVTGLDNHIFVTENPKVGESGVVYQFQNNAKIDSVSGGLNLQDICAFKENGETCLAYIAVGDYFATHSDVIIAKKNTETGWSKTTIPVGAIANNLIYDNGYLYCVCNRSNSVAKINPNLGKVERFYYVGTSGWSGPRQMIIKDGNAFISTFSGDLRVLSFESGIVDVVKTNGKTEGIVKLKDGKIAVASQYLNDYKSNNVIDILDKYQYDEYTKYFKVKCGKSPIFALGTNENNLNTSFYVFCRGYDANQNGKFDNGDEKPSMWTIHPMQLCIIPNNTNNLAYSEKLEEYEMNSFADDFNPIIIPSKTSSEDILIIPFKEHLQFLRCPHNWNEEFISKNYEQYKNYKLTQLVLDNEEKNTFWVYGLDSTHTKCFQFIVNANNFNIEIHSYSTPYENEIIDYQKIYADKEFKNCILMKNINNYELSINDSIITKTNILAKPDIASYNDTLLITAIDDQHNIYIEKIDIANNQKISTLQTGVISKLDHMKLYDSKFMHPYLSNTKVPHFAFFGNNYGLNFINKNDENLSSVLPVIENSTIYADKYYYSSSKSNINACLFGATNSSNGSPRDSVYVFGDMVFGNIENEEKTNFSITLSPNPSNEYLNVMFKNQINNDISIVNISGEIIYKTHIYGNELKINLKYLGINSGTYFVVLNTNDYIVSKMFNYIQ